MSGKRERDKNPVRSSGFAALLGAAILLGGAAGPARGADDPGRRAAEAIEKALKRHGPAVHRCFEQALADRLDVAGDVEVEVDIGPGGKVTAAKLRPRGGGEAPQALSACVESSARGFQIEGIEAGASVVLPFTFSGQVDQFVIKVADVPERGAKPAGKRAVAAPPAPFSVKVLVDPVNVRTPRAALTLLTVSPKNRVAMHRHPGAAKALYLLSGRARVLGPSGAAPIMLDPGTALFVPSGHPHAIETLGSKDPAVLLQVFSPPGPEQVYRTPGDADARAAFEVVRDPGKALVPAGALAPVAVSAAKIPSADFLGGKGKARVLLQQTITSSADLSLSVLDLAAGATWTRHNHDGASEILYIASGAGTLEVGSETTPFSDATALYLPAGQPHALRVTAPVHMIQVFAPGGAERALSGEAAAQHEPHKKEEASKVIR